MLLKGLTVHYLIFSTYHGEEGRHRAVARRRRRRRPDRLPVAEGARRHHHRAPSAPAEKLALAKAHGADHLINYSTENFAERVKEITGGKGVPVVYDGVGKTTWEGSLDCLRPRGLMVTFGNASGRGAAGEPRHPRGQGLALRHAPDARHAHRQPRRPRSSARTRCSRSVKSGKVKIETTAKYKLADAAAGAPRPRGTQNDRPASVTSCVPLNEPLDVRTGCAGHFASAARRPAPSTATRTLGRAQRREHAGRGAGADRRSRRTGPDGPASRDARAAPEGCIPGQVSFPGGRVDPRTQRRRRPRCARRRRRSGSTRARRSCSRRLPDYRTRHRLTASRRWSASSRRRSSCGRMPTRWSEVFEVPLAFLLDPANHRRESREWQGELRRFFVMPHERHYIWGATAGMLVNLSLAQLGAG